MKRYPRLPLAVAAAALGLVLSWAWGQEPGSAAVQRDAPNTHNMLVIGEETVYLSHLPMFQESGKRPMPHRYQAILEVSFPGQESYAKDRRAHRSTPIYMLNPETFVLPDLASADKPLASFNANTIVRGHLERKNPVPILEDVKVKVNRVIHFRQFDPDAKRPESLEYLLFGKGKELFLAHRIAAPPDFDHVLSVTIADNPFTDDELARGIPVAFPGKKDTVAERIKAKQQIQGEARLAGSSAPRKIDVRVERELYFEEGELRMPPTFATTPEEKQAGFP
jgi:hypothetical protein